MKYWHNRFHGIREKVPCHENSTVVVLKMTWYARWPLFAITFLECNKQRPEKVSMFNYVLQCRWRIPYLHKTMFCHSTGDTKLGKLIAHIVSCWWLSVCLHWNVTLDNFIVKTKKPMPLFVWNSEQLQGFSMIIIVLFNKCSKIDKKQIKTYLAYCRMALFTLVFKASANKHLQVVIQLLM